MAEIAPPVDTKATEVPAPGDGEKRSLRPVHPLEVIGDYPVFDPDMFGLPGNEIDLAGYAPTMELAIVRHRLCQVFVSPHVGQIPAKIWVPIPGQ